MATATIATDQYRTVIETSHRTIIADELKERGGDLGPAPYDPRCWRASAPARRRHPAQLAADVASGSVEPGDRPWAPVPREAVT